MFYNHQNHHQNHHHTHNRSLSSPLRQPPTTPTIHAHNNCEPQEYRSNTNTNNLLNLSISSLTSNSESGDDEYMMNHHDLTSSGSRNGGGNSSSPLLQGTHSLQTYPHSTPHEDQRTLENGISFHEGEQCMTNFNAKYISPGSDDDPSNLTSSSSNNRDCVDYFRCKRLKLKQVSANIKFKEIFEMVKQIPPPMTLTLSCKLYFLSRNAIFNIIAHPTDHY